MASHILTGKPGGGKGYVSVEKFILPEILYGERCVVTSLDVKVEPWVRVSRRFGRTSFQPELGMRNYLLQTHGKDFNVRDRVFRITDEQAMEFFLYRVRDGKLITLDAVRDDKGRVVSYDTTNPGVPIMFVIDEAPMLFGSRDWANTSKGLLFYNRQHRKTNDEIVYCAQHTKDMESALQRVAQDFVNCTNRGKMNFKIFTQPSVIQIDTYDKPPLGPAVTPMKTTFTKIDKKGIGSCFDTSSGVGMSAAGGADMNEKKKGVPWWIIPIALCLIAVLLSKGSDYLGSAMTRAFGFGNKKLPAQVVTKTNPSEARAPIHQAKTELPVATNAQPAITCLGYFRFSSDRTVALLSDGREVTQPELESVTKTQVRVSGVALKLVAPGATSARESMPATPSRDAASQGPDVRQ